jgi:hypothetical protein
MSRSAARTPRAFHNIAEARSLIEFEQEGEAASPTRSRPFALPRQHLQAAPQKAAQLGEAQKLHEVT